jgi:hypothetical protein
MIETAIRKISVEIEQYTDALAHGNVEDYADYKRLVGHVAGMTRAKRILEELLAHSEKDPD